MSRPKQNRTAHESAGLLPSRFIRECRRRLFSQKIVDSTGVRLTGGGLLAATLALRRLLKRHVLATDETNVGVLLPPSAGAVLANTSLALSRRVAVNLNYTFSDAMLNGCIRRAGIRHVLTSRAFLERRPAALDAEMVCLEDLRPRASWLDMAAAVAEAYLCPAAVLEQRLGLRQLADDDLLAVLFTSGTTGEPKGVMLSQRNVAANVDGIRDLLRFIPAEVVMAVLPFFHAFGYTLGMWAVLVLPVGGVYHYSPLDAREIGRLCQQHRVTLLEATPTFLRLYLKRCQKEQFADLELAVVGGEKLSVELARAFADKFGVVPTEGFGTTELSPLATGNAPDARSGHPERNCFKLGTAGRPLAGVEAKIVDPDSSQDLGRNREGLLWIRGDNVMRGYLGDPQRTAAVIRDGWYNTGDLARIDDEGFVEILGRQSRFSKIGGEMVPHAGLEEALEKLVGTGDSEELHFGVTGVPDAARGERLVVLHSPLGIPVEALLTRLRATDLPRLWIPDERSFLEIPEIPRGPLGKIDLGALNRIARAGKVGGPAEPTASLASHAPASDAQK